MNSLIILGIVALAASLFACRAFQLDAARERQRANHHDNMSRIFAQQRDEARNERDDAIAHAEAAQIALSRVVTRDVPRLQVVEVQ